MSEDIQPSHQSVIQPGIPDQTREMLELPNPTNNLPGCTLEHHFNDHCLTRGEDGIYCTDQSSDASTHQGSLQELSTLIGRMSHAAQTGVWIVPLPYRMLQKIHVEQIQHWGFKSKKHILQLQDSALKDLGWWIAPELVQFNQQAIQLPPFDLSIRTDASLTGWGTTCNNQSTGSHWGPLEAKQHINALELKAAYLALQSFLSQIHPLPRHILLEMDNTTAVAYLNKRSGTHSTTLSDQALQMWEYVLNKGSWITARHIPGVLNVEADFASRQFNPHTEWMLDKTIFKKITVCFFVLEIDLFASRLNHKVPLYMSRDPDPGSMAVDAFRQSWGRWKSFIHSRIIQKVWQDTATTLLVPPSWPGQPWYPELCQMLIDHPLQLPIRESLLTLPFRHRMTHPLWRSLRLTVWPISGSAIEQQAFHRKLSRFSSHRGLQPPRKGTVPPGILGPSGVLVMDCVQFQHL